MSKRRGKGLSSSDKEVLDNNLVTASKNILINMEKDFGKLLTFRNSNRNVCIKCKIQNSCIVGLFERGVILLCPICLKMEMLGVVKDNKTGNKSLCTCCGKRFKNGDYAMSNVGMVIVTEANNKDMLDTEVGVEKVDDFKKYTMKISSLKHTRRMSS